MYDRDRIAERLDSATEQLGWRPEYHTVEEVDQVKRALDRIANFNDLGQFVDMKRPFTEREQRWIRNERMLCACDAAYFCEKYAYIKDEKNNIKRFSFRAPQRIYFAILAELERRGAAIQIQVLKARQLGMCLDPDTKVLTSDLRWVRIDDVQEGDILVGVDEGMTQEEWKARQTENMRLYRAGQPRPEKKKNLPDRKMLNTVVEAKREVFEEAVRLHMADGRELVATPQHRFLVKQRNGPQPVWKTVSELRTGDSIRHITTTWSAPTYEDGWFGGLFDGEGSLRTKAGVGVEACVAQVEGKVLERAKKWLDDNGISYRIEIDNRKGGESSKLGNKPVHKLVVARMNEAFRMVGMTQPSRFKRDFWIGKSLPGKKSGDAWTKIVGIEELPARRMIDIQTSAKTFIAEGFVSHNSTITELLVAHRIFFTYGVNAVIASSAQQQTQIMSQMIFLVYDNLPYWMQPPPTRRVESDKGMLVLGGIQSGVSFQHGSQTSGIARGTTPTVIHLSEVASFPNAEDLIEASLFRAVHESPNVFMVLESTAEGVDNWWHRTWKASKSGWTKGRARLCPLFLPWYVGTDIYPTATWLQTRPVPADWKPIRETRGMMAKAKMYVNSDPLLSSVLGENWTMGAAQAWFWEVNYEEYRSKGREKLWSQEMPGDDIECFQSSFDSVFGNDLLGELHEARTKEYGIYAIEGQGIEDKFRPYDEDLDWDKPRRIVQYRNARGESYTWTLIPLLDSCIEVPDDPMDPDMENALEQADGKLLIFHEPRPGMDYTIGVDSGQGVGGDSTVISVWAKGKGGVPDIQCAEFSSNLVSHIEAYPFVMAIASLYMKHMDHPREPLVSIEVLAAVGDMVQLQMGKMGYSRFHQFVRYDSKKISKRKAVKRGWFTTSWSRPLLVDGFTHSVKNGWVEIHSPFLLAEMKNFEVHMTGGGKEKLEHADGSHDDRVFAGAIAVFTSHDLDAMVERGKKRYIPASQNYRPEVDISEYNAGNFIGDQQFSAQIKTSNDLENLMSDRFSY